MMCKNLYEIFIRLDTEKKRPLQEYINLSEAKEMLKYPEIIDALESLHTVCITKLICGYEELIAKYPNKHYSILKLLYENELSDEFTKRFLEETETDILCQILPLLDEKHLKKFQDIFTLQKELQETEKKLQKIEDDIKTKKGKKSKEEKNKNQSSEQSSNPKEKEKTQLKKEKKKLEEKIQKQKCLLLSEQTFEEKENFFNQLNQYISSFEEKQKKARIQAKEIIQNKKYEDIAEELIKISDGNTLSKFKDLGKNKDELEKVCHVFDKWLKNRVYIEEVMRTIAKLYSDGTIDINEDPVLSLLKNNKDTLSQFIIRYRCEIESEDYIIFRNILLDATIEQKSLIKGEPAFFGLWESMEKDDEQLSILDYYEKHSKLTYEQILCYLYLYSQKTRPFTEMLINEHIYGDNAEQNSISEFIETMIDCTGSDKTNIDFALKLVRNLEKEYHKNKYAFVRANKKLQKFPQKVYIHLNTSITELEKLASDMADSVRTEEYLSTLRFSLKKQIAELRKGLSEIGLKPIGDIEKWLNDFSVEPDPSKYDLPDEVPEKIKLRTLGYSYQNDNGKEISKHALVSHLNISENISNSD